MSRKQIPDSVSVAISSVEESADDARIEEKASQEAPVVMEAVPRPIESKPKKVNFFPMLRASPILRSMF